MSAQTLQLHSGLEPFPGYRLITAVGSGAFSEVWKAEGPNGACALKFMACRHETVPAAEIRALQGLRHVRHANLLGIDHVWSCPGYIVVGMEFADGSLLDLLEVYLRELDAPMSPEHVIFFLSQAAEGLDFLNERRHDVHDQRVAFRHCDVKPGNLLVFGQQVRLADFGLAVPVTTAGCQLRPVGTPAYAAPEVFRGWLSDRSDQYSLAVTYFQLRSGRFPFGEPAMSFSAGPRGTLDLTRVTAGEQDVLRRALAAAPQDRWPSCQELMRRLRRAVPNSRARTVVRA